MDMQDFVNLLRSQGLAVPEPEQIRRNVVFVIAETKPDADAKCVDLANWIVRQKLQHTNGVLAVYCGVSVDEFFAILTSPDAIDSLPSFLLDSERKIFVGFGERATNLLVDFRSAIQDMSDTPEKQKFEVLLLDEAVPQDNHLSPEDTENAYIQAIVDLCNQPQG